MDPEIRRRGPFRVLGVVARFSRGSESPELFGKIWKTFEIHHAGIKGCSTDRCYYGATYPGATAGEMEYLAGMAVLDDTPAPEGIEARTIPAGEYAVFACEVSAIGETYRYIFADWFPGSGFEVRPAAVSFEQYPPEGEGAEVLIHIPVRRPEEGKAV